MLFYSRIKQNEKTRIKHFRKTLFFKCFFFTGKFSLIKEQIEEWKRGRIRNKTCWIILFKLDGNCVYCVYSSQK